MEGTEGDGRDYIVIFTLRGRRDGRDIRAIRDGSEGRKGWKGDKGHKGRKGWKGRKGLYGGFCAFPCVSLYFIVVHWSPFSCSNVSQCNPRESQTIPDHSYMNPKIYFELDIPHARASRFP